MKKFTFAFGVGIILLMFLGFLLYTFSLITISIVGGFLLYLLVDQLMEVLERNKVTGGFAYFCVALIFLISVLVITLFVALPLVTQVQTYLGEMPALLTQINERITVLQEDFPFVMPLYETIKENAISSLTKLLSHSGSIVTGAVTGLLMAIILIGSRKNLSKNIIEKIPNDYFEVAVSIGHRIVDHIKKYVAAKSVETIIITLIYFIGFWAIGLPAPMLFAIVGGLLNLIPYIGVLFTAIPVGLAALLAGGYPLLVLSMITLAVARLIDDFVLQTYLVGHFVKVHPFLVVLITLIGGEFMGVIGLIIAIPFYVISKIVVIGLYDYLRSMQRHARFLKEEHAD